MIRNHGRSRNWGARLPPLAGFTYRPIRRSRVSNTANPQPVTLNSFIRSSTMKPSTTNIARGDGNIAAGKTKEVAGKVVNSPKLQAKGAVQQVAGEFQKAVGKVQKSQGS